MEKIKKLKKLLEEYDLDAYLVPKNDEFFNEYVPQYKDKLKFISNFSGSYGFALISKNKNYLFVDGRYTLQAKIQSGKLFKIITMPNKLPAEILKRKKLKVGFDPKLHTKKMLDIFFKNTNLTLLPIAENLIENISLKKRNNKFNKFYVLPKKAVGQNYTLKINKLVRKLIKKKIDLHFISAGENIAWLLNIRGRDSEFSPMPNGYLIVNRNKKIKFFCDLRKFPSHLKINLKI